MINAPPKCDQPPETADVQAQSHLPLAVHLQPKAIELLLRLVATGLYGRDLPDAAERLLCEKLREIADSNASMADLAMGNLREMIEGYLERERDHVCPADAEIGPRALRPVCGCGGAGTWPDADAVHADAVAVLTPDGRITLPEHVRAVLGIRPGDFVYFLKYGSKGIRFATADEMPGEVPPTDPPASASGA